MAPDELKTVWKLRRVLHALDQQQAIELLLGKLRETKSNFEFLLQVQKTTPMAVGPNSDDDEEPAAHPFDLPVVLDHRGPSRCGEGLGAVSGVCRRRSVHERGIPAYRT